MLIAGSRVLLRLLVPRHPLYALYNFTIVYLRVQKFKFLRWRLKLIFFRFSIQKELPLYLVFKDQSSIRCTVALQLQRST